MSDETAEVFRALRTAGKARRARRELREEAALARAVASGVLNARQLSPYHWRCWLVAAPGNVADFWPRSGLTRFRDHNTRGGVKALLRVLEGARHG